MKTSLAQSMGITYIIGFGTAALETLDKDAEKIQCCKLFDNGMLI